MKRTCASVLPLATIRAFLLTGAFAGLSACGAPPDTGIENGDETPALTEDGKATQIDDSMMVNDDVSEARVAAGVRVSVAPEANRRDSAKELARLVAAALRHADVRSDFYEAMNASTVKEGKLYL